MFSVVQEALDKEPDKDVVAGFLDSLCQVMLEFLSPQLCLYKSLFKCVKEIGKQGLTREQTGEIMKVLQVRLGEHFKSVADIQGMTGGVCRNRIGRQKFGFVGIGRVLNTQNT